MLMIEKLGVLFMILAAIVKYEVSENKRHGYMGKTIGLLFKLASCIKLDTMLCCPF